MIILIEREQRSLAYRKKKIYQNFHFHIYIHYSISAASEFKGKYGIWPNEIVLFIIRINAYI